MAMSENPSTQKLPIKESPPKDILRFTPEARSALETAGYLIYGLTGESIKTLRDQGRPFWNKWHENESEFEAVISRLSEAAINPEALLLDKSNGKIFPNQQKMVADFS